MSLQLLFRCAEIDSIIPKTVLWFNLGEREMLGLCNILGIHARQLRITTIDEWRALARTCHTVHYHDKNDRGTNWFELGTTPYTIQQWSSIQSITRIGEFKDKTIISVCDTAKRKRILIDGNKRATVLTSEVQSQKRPTIDISIYEWYGECVNMIFPCEFCHLYGTSLDATNTSTRTAK